MKNFLWWKKVATETVTPNNLNLKILMGLILVDLVVIGLNFYNSWIPDDQWSEFLALASDNSIGELVQYCKWFLITVLFVLLIIKRSSISYLSWALVFLYLLLDDSMQIHETVGGYLMQGYDFATPGGLRLQDIGELAVSAIAGSTLLLISIWAYKKGDDFFKITTQNMLYLFLALVFFGVVFDVIAVMVYSGNITAFFFDVFEDGGEMIVASLMLWYAVLVSQAKNGPVSFMDSIRMILKNKH